MTTGGITGPEATPPSKPGGPVEGPTEVTGKGQQEPKEFRGPGAEKAPETETTDKISPMDLAGQDQRKSAPTQESLDGQLNKLNDTLEGAKNQLQTTTQIRPDQEEALNKLVDKMNGDMNRIAKHSETEFTPRKQGSGEKMLEFVTGWIDGSQSTLQKALASVSQLKNPNPGQLMNLQYSVQRATQRGELFSSIIGSSVSGIKTIMSTQLG